MTPVTQMHAPRGALTGPERAGRRPARVIAFGLSGEEWDALIAAAVAEGRDPFQQARWFVLQAIRLRSEETAAACAV